jgi:cell division protein FtsB
MRKTFRDRIFTLQEYIATLFVSRLRRRVFVTFAAIVVLAFLFLFSNKGLIRRLQLSGEKRELNQQLEMSKRQQDSLKTVRDQLQGDPFTIEKVAREQYGLARPGETIYRRAPRQESK